MKAKVKASGDIIEVKEWRGSSNVVYSTPDMNMFYASDEVEILSEKSEEAVLEGWVCRDGREDIKDSILRLYLKGEPFPDNDKPERIGMGYLQMWKGANGLHLPSEMFPEVTWATEPKRVKITITPIEE
ncbi:MAG: hypothetical protein HDR49_00490 [Bacteroides sp.]|nr:hypothetical protein [Bacteroides sp.]